MNKYILFCVFLCVSFLVSCSDNTKVESPTVQETPSNISQEDTQTPAEENTPRAKPSTPSFTKTEIDFTHQYDKNKALAFLGGTFFDLENDGKNEFIITGWADQADGVFHYNWGKIVDITAQTGIANPLPSYGAYAIDFDENGYDDLFIARQDGIYYYENTNGRLNEKKLEITLPKNAIPLDIDFADIDGDANLDMYVSTFIDQSLFRSAVFNDANHVQRNLLLQNDGDLKFSDITKESGLDITANTFTASFADLDNDGDADIVISPNTDTAKIYKNTDGKFSLAYENNIYGFWMGLALSDYDNDGDIDVFFSNVGTSIPEKFLSGDSRSDQVVKAQYLFVENTGNMNFSEKKDPSFDELGFGWWIVAHDFNFDERSDFLIMQNYIKWAPHKLSKLPGELLISDGNTWFIPKISEYDIENKNYGISALVGDVNDDSFDDIIYLNLNGTPGVYLRDTDTGNNFFKIDIPNTAKYIGAKFTLLADEAIIHEKTYLPKQGLMTRQDSSITFGLNAVAANPNTLKIQYQNGEIEILDISDTSSIFKL